MSPSIYEASLFRTQYAFCKHRRIDTLLLALLGNATGVPTFKLTPFSTMIDLRTNGRALMIYNDVCISQLLAGICFRDASGAPAAQCLLTQQLECVRTGQRLVAATFHMKAKAGTINDGIRCLQVWCPLRVSRIEHALRCTLPANALVLAIFHCNATKVLLCRP